MDDIPLTRLAAAIFPTGKQSDRILSATFFIERVLRGRDRNAEIGKLCDRAAVAGSHTMPCLAVHARLLRRITSAASASGGRQGQVAWVKLHELGHRPVRTSPKSVEKRSVRIKALCAWRDDAAQNDDAAAQNDDNDPQPYKLSVDVINALMPSSDDSITAINTGGDAALSWPTEALVETETKAAEDGIPIIPMMYTVFGGNERVHCLKQCFPSRDTLVQVRIII